MIELKKLSLLDIMPGNLIRDENVRQTAEAIDAQLNGVAGEIDLIRILERFDSLPESFINLLAWQYHVDFYDESLALEKKRNLVKIAIATHRIKGTKKAVENVVTAAFGNADVTEWFDYGGKPYHFRVAVSMDSFPTEERVAALRDSINSVKNVRSWLDDEDLTFAYAHDVGIRVAVASDLRRIVTLEQEAEYEAPAIERPLYIGGVVKKRQDITPGTLSSGQRARVAIAVNIVRTVGMEVEM